MKKLAKFFILFFTLLLFFHDTAVAIDSCQKTFTDLSDSSKELQDAVSCMNLNDYCVVRGFPDDTFRRDDPLTRAEFVSFIIRYHYQVLHDESWKIPEDIPDSEITFSDVPKTHGNYLEVYTSKKLGFVKGYPDGTFRPEDLWLYGFHGIWRNDNEDVKKEHPEDCFEGCYDTSVEGDPITRGEFIDAIYRYGQEHNELDACQQTIKQCNQCSRINGCEQTTFSSRDNCKTATGDVIRSTDTSCGRLNNPEGSDLRCDTEVPPEIPHCPVLPIDTGMASYTISVPKEGDYALWTSVRAGSGMNYNQNTVFAQVDLTCGMRIGGVGYNEPWLNVSWNGKELSNPIFHLTAGEHTIRFIGESPGVMFYGFFLTSDLACSMSVYTSNVCKYSQSSSSAAFGLTAITPTVTILPTTPITTVTPPIKTSPLPTSTSSSKSSLQFRVSPSENQTP